MGLMSTRSYLLDFSTPLRTRPALLAGAAVLLGACGGDDVASEEDARLAYMGLHVMVDKSVNLGLDGYNAATSANIPDQEGEGDLQGRILIGGQVDQGVSDNKELRLDIELEDYQDEVIDESEEGEDEPLEIDLIYASDEEELPHADISLRNIPDGTFDGTLVGSFHMEGDLEGEVFLDLQIEGEIEPVDGEGEGEEDEIRRVPGETQITGTAESRYGDFDVDLTI